MTIVSSWKRRMGWKMGIIVQITKIICVLILLESSSFAEIPFEIRTVPENVVIGRDISVPGNLLCNNGMFVFYKDKNSCLSSGEKGCDNLLIGPINQVEKIHIANGYFITRFFKVDLKYEKKFLRLVNGKQEIVSQKFYKVPYCKNMVVHEPHNTLSERKADIVELPILMSFLFDGIEHINTPFGLVKSIKRVNQESHDLDNIPLMMLTNIRSPFCGEPSVQEYVKKISGEYSGNGWYEANMRYLQGSSGEVRPANLIELKTYGDYANAKYVCLRTFSI